MLFIAKIKDKRKSQNTNYLERIRSAELIPDF